MMRGFQYSGACAWMRRAVERCGKNRETGGARALSSVWSEVEDFGRPRSHVGASHNGQERERAVVRQRHECERRDVAWRSQVVARGLNLLKVRVAFELDVADHGRWRLRIELPAAAEVLREHGACIVVVRGAVRRVGGARDCKLLVHRARAP
eukprot:5310325-Prymnesium_polylepis.2